ncbi:ABC transporter permease, partial [Rhizobium ruizarguesonis]
TAGFWQSRTLATPETDQATALFGTFSVCVLGYAGIFATMIVIALLTTFTARLTVMRTIYEIGKKQKTAEHQGDYQQAA